jgi:hypothetical protein
VCSDGMFFSIHVAPGARVLGFPPTHNVAISVIT